MKGLFTFSFVLLGFTKAFIGYPALSKFPSFPLKEILFKNKLPSFQIAHSWRMAGEFFNTIQIERKGK